MSILLLSIHQAARLNQEVIECPSFARCHVSTLLLTASSPSLLALPCKGNYNCDLFKLTHPLPLISEPAALGVNSIRGMFYNQGEPLGEAAAAATTRKPLHPMGHGKTRPTSLPIGLKPYGAQPFVLCSRERGKHMDGKRCLSAPRPQLIPFSSADRHR